MYRFLSSDREETYCAVSAILERDMLMYISSLYRSVYGLRLLFKGIELGRIQVIAYFDEHDVLNGIGLIERSEVDGELIGNMHVLTLPNANITHDSIIALKELKRVYGYDKLEVYIPENNRAARIFALKVGMKKIGTSYNVKHLDVNFVEVPCIKYVYDEDGE